MIIEAIIGIALIYFIGKKLGFKINKKEGLKQINNVDEAKKKEKYNAYMKEYQRKRREMKRQNAMENHI